MKILVAITSRVQCADNHQSMRDTWLPEALSLGIDYRFFVQMAHSQKTDVVCTNSEEWAMSERLRFKVQWAYERGYDYIFSCYPDTYVRPDRLLRCGFDNYDYFGCMFQYPGGTPYCQGGAGYLLNRKAMEVVTRETSSYLNDDCWLGDVLNGRVRIGHSADFRQWEGSPLKDNTVVTSHLSFASNALGVPYASKFMYAEHKKWLDSGGVLIPHNPIEFPVRMLRWKRRR